MFGRGKREKKGDNKIDGYIGKGVAITGKLHFEGIVRLDGRFNGEIDSSGTLIIGDDSVIEAKIRVDNAIIGGEVRGEVEAASRIELKKPCRMYGRLKTPNLIIGEGVTFEGNCDMGEEKKDITSVPEGEMSETGD